MVDAQIFVPSNSMFAEAMPRVRVPVQTNGVRYAKVGQGVLAEADASRLSAPRLCT